MIQPLLLLLPLIFVLGCCEDSQSQAASIDRDHELKNIEKINDLRALWYGRHPVKFPPLSDEDKRFLETYSIGSENEPTSKTNDEMSVKLIEGDIIPSNQDIAEMEERLRMDDERRSGKVVSERDRRAAPWTSKTKWDRSVPIPYIMDKRFTKEQQIFIRSVIDTIVNNTCIDFQENGPGMKLEYVMNGLNGGCSSFVGDERKNSVESQKIYLDLSCVTIQGITHETMHALGFDHTHSRTDRDENIKFNPDNIEKSWIPQFDKLPDEESVTNYGIPYEFNSVMHYPMTGTFQIDSSKPGFIPKDRGYVRTVYGERPIFNDWKIINMHYKCHEICNITMQCHNGGYQHPRLCDECVCPQFYTGTECKEEKDVLTLMPGKIEKVDFGFPLNVDAYYTVPIQYEKYQRSQFRLIKAPEGNRIRVIIHRIHDFKNYCPEKCDEKALEIVDGDLTRVGKRFCCQNCTETPIPYTFISETNVIGYHVFARAGLDFQANVTFSVENVPTSPQTEQTTTTVEPQTEDPDVEQTQPSDRPTTISDEPQTNPHTPGTEKTESTEDPDADETEPTEDTGTDEIEPTEEPDTDETEPTEDPGTDESEPREGSGTDESESREEPWSDETGATEEDPETEDPGSTEPYALNPRFFTTSTNTSESEEKEPSRVQEMINSIRDLLSEITDNLGRLAELVGDW